MRALIELFDEYEKAEVQRDVAKERCNELLEQIKTLVARKDYNASIRRMMKLIDFDVIDPVPINIPDNRPTMSSRILEHVKENPGKTAKEIQYDLGLGDSGSACVSKMVMRGEVVRADDSTISVIDDGGSKKEGAVEGGGSTDGPLLTAPEIVVLGMVLDTESVSVPAISKSMMMKEQNVHVILSRLEKAGYVKQLQDGWRRTREGSEIIESQKPIEIEDLDVLRRLNTKTVVGVKRLAEERGEDWQVTKMRLLRLRENGLVAQDVKLFWYKTEVGVEVENQTKDMSIDVLFVDVPVSVR